MLVLGQLVVQRLQADAQKPRRASLVPFNLPKSLEDQTLLRFRERRAERKRKGGMVRACSLDFCRQMRRTNNRSLQSRTTCSIAFFSFRVIPGHFLVFRVFMAGSSTPFAVFPL